MRLTVLSVSLFFSLLLTAVTSSADTLFLPEKNDLRRQLKVECTPENPFPQYPMPQVVFETPNENRYIYNCSNCQRIFRKWIHVEKELREAVWFCGFDYLSVRFTQSFALDSMQSTLVVHTHSLPDYSLQVDSVITSFDIPRGTEETSAKIIPQSPAQPCLSLPSVKPLFPDISEHLVNVLQTASRFQSRCVIDGEGNPEWSFFLQQKMYSIRKGEIVTKPLKTAPGKSGTAVKDYRLETWGSTTYAPSPHHREHSVPPELAIASVNDSQSITRVRIIARSEYGLSSCILSSGALSDTLRFSGEKQWSNSITVNALPEDTLLTVTVTDIHGNRKHRCAPLFLHQHAQQQTKAEKREIELYTLETVRSNPVLYGTWLLGQFSGNPVSFVARKALDHHTKRKYSTMGDYSLPPPSDTITFPLAGNVHTPLLEFSLGRISTPLSADTVTFNGTQIVRLVNPRPFSASTGNRFITITLEAPFSEGRHPLRWEIDSLKPTAFSDTYATSLLLCSSATYEQEDLTLRNIPHILDHSSNQTAFTLCHFPDQQQTDTITITYRIRYTDCSTALLYEQYRIQKPDIVNCTVHQPTELHTVPSIHIGHAGQSEVLLHVSVVGKKDIFRIDAFVHSRRQNRITGWGAASLPG